MGLFSSKKETIVGTSVSRIIRDELLPSAIKTGMMRSLFSDERDVDAILDELTSCIGLKAERMYTFAKDRYVHGLPKRTVVNSASLEDKIANVLSVHHDSPVTIIYGKFGPLNNLHAGWTQLFNQYAYNGTTNQLGTLTQAKGVPVFLKDMVVVVKEATAAEWESGELELWDNPRSGQQSVSETEMAFTFRRIQQASKVEVNPTLASDIVKVTYTWTVGNTQHTETINIPLVGFDEAADYFQAKYTVGGTQHILTYLDNSGGILGLDQIFTTEFDNTGSFFPFGYLRWNRSQLDSDKTGREYTDSKKLFNYLGIDYQHVLDSIKENPDIGDVEQAVMMMAVPANSTDPLEQRYLFDFFKQLHAYTGGTGNVPTVARGILAKLINKSDTSNSVIIQDARFKLSLAYGTLHKKLKVGNLGEVGSHFLGRGTYTISQTVTLIDSETGESSERTDDYSYPTYYYRKQVSPTMYEEYEASNLQLTYFITEKYRTTSTDNEKILMIPVDHSITEHYSIVDREELYARSLHYIFNSMVFVKVKWYQQEWFGDVLLIAAIVMTVASLGSDSGMFIQTATAIVAALALTIPVWVIQVVLIFAMQEAFKLAAKVIGPNLALIFAVAMVAYGGYTAFGSTAGVNTVAFSSFTAKDLLYVASGLSSGASAAVAESFKDLQDNQKDFGQEAEAKMKVIEDTNKLLGDQMNMTPFVVFGESPDDFFRRTVHSGNIGTLGYDYIHNYVDMNLALPKFAQTIGGIY